MGAIESASGPAPHFSGCPGHRPGQADQSVCQFVASGEFTASDHDLVREMLAEAFAAGCPQVEIDFGSVPSIDAGTARMLADCRYHAIRHGCQLTIVNLAPRRARSVQTLRGISVV